MRLLVVARYFDNNFSRFDTIPDCDRQRTDISWQLSQSPSPWSCYYSLWHSELIDKHDTHLFRSITYTDHCLHYLLPEKLNRSRNLRHRGHEYTLSHIRTTHLKNDFHQYFTRSSSHLHLLRVNTSYGSRCIKFKASQLWNTIPEELKLINKLNSFKNHLKSHLFNDIIY